MHRLLHHRDEWRSRERNCGKNANANRPIVHISYAVSWFIHRVEKASPRLKDALLNFVKFKSLLSCHPEVLSL